MTPWFPAMPYSPDLPEAFQAQHGYELRRNLPPPLRRRRPKGPAVPLPLLANV